MLNMNSIVMIIFHAEVNSTEVRVLWSLTMALLYCMTPGTFAVRLR